MRSFNLGSKPLITAAELAAQRARALFNSMEDPEVIYDKEGNAVCRVFYGGTGTKQ